MLALTMFAHGQSASVILDGQLAVGIGSSGPTAPVTGMKVWYSADCITFTSSVCGTPSNGASFSAWADHSGNADNLTVITGTCNFNTSQVNAKPAVAFNGTCALDLGSTITPTASTWTIFVVYQRASAASGKGQFVSMITSGAFQYGTDSALGMQELSGSGPSVIAHGTAATDTSFHQMNVLWEGISNGNVAQFRIDRTADGSVTPSASIANSQIQTVGANRNNGTQFLDGKLAELIIYDGALTSPQITANEAYLHGKYGL